MYIKVESIIINPRISGRGYGQCAQHSQSLHNIFSHIPGLKAAMPATACDAKGLLIGPKGPNAPPAATSAVFILGCFEKSPRKCSV